MTETTETSTLTIAADTTVAEQALEDLAAALPTPPTPRTSTDAANLLLADFQHVHHTYDGHTDCLNDTCTTPLLDGLV